MLSLIDPATTPAEQWRPVPDFEEYYEVSNLGRIRSLDRDYVNAAGRNRRVKGRIIVLVNKPSGYKGVCLCVGGKQTGKNVHRLVAMAFIGPPPFVKAEVNHKDGNKSNNHYSNLEWCSRAENVQHAVDTGLMPTRNLDHLRRFGEDNPACTITDSKVFQIRKRLADGEMGAAIARDLGISAGQVSRIRNNKRRAANA